MYTSMKKAARMACHGILQAVLRDIGIEGTFAANGQSLETPALVLVGL
jgi:hypothetical protein